MAEDKKAGTARNVGGKIEEATGDLTGDAKMQAEGKADQIAGEAQAAFGDVKDAVSSAAGDAETALAGMAQRVGSQASELGGQAYEQGAQAARYVSKRIHEEPLVAMLAVGALGILVGYLIGHRPHQRAVELGRFRAGYRDR